MNARVLNEQTFLLVFDKGDEVTDSLLDFANERELGACYFTAIGAFQDCVLGYFDREQKDYQRNPVDEQVEVTSLIGNIARTEDGKRKVHAHVVLGRRDGSAQSGHLIKAHVWPTLEMILAHSQRKLKRVTDSETGLPLLHLD